MYLVDTNVWLERLLDQVKSEDVRYFLERTPSEYLFITDFTFHSIGIVLSKVKRMEIFLNFVQDLLIDGAIVLIHLEPEDTPRLINVIKQFGFDFDDAYQYVAAEKYNLTIVSFDSDFDQTKQGRKTPADI